MNQPTDAKQIYERLGFRNRTALLWGEEAMDHLRTLTVAIAGCGGVGGAAALLLARMGVGGFVLADPGLFDEPDINRQWGATHSALGRNKAEVYEELLGDINPEVRVQVFKEGVTPATLEAIVDPADSVVDCLDIDVPLDLRLSFYQRAYANNKYCISAPILGVGTLLLAARPGGMPLDGVIANIIEEAARDSKLPAGFEKYLFPESIDAINRHIQKNKVPSVALTPALAASATAAEIVFGLLHPVNPQWRKPLALPDVFVMDLMQLNYLKVDYRELFPNARDVSQ